MTSYESIWDSYWSNLPEGPREAIWDIDATLAADAHLPLFAQHFSADLPLVDFGCGNGTQTKTLARRFAHVVGIDISEPALQRARETNAGPGIEYRKVDLLDPGAAQALHDAIGDANVYDRTVIHQFQPEDWPAAMQSLAAITGKHGRAFLIEFGPAGHAYLAGIVKRFGGPPPKLAQAFNHGIRPAELKEGDLEHHLGTAGLEIVTSGPLDYLTTQSLPDETMMVIPAQYTVVRPALRG